MTKKQTHRRETPSHRTHVPRTRTGSRLIGFKLYLVVLLAVSCCIAGALTASATSYTDTFANAPFSGTVGSFTTGTSSTGLSYSGSNLGMQYSSTYGHVTALSVIWPGEASLTIASRDGRAFAFNSIHVDTLQALRIVGKGPEAFTINVSTGFVGTKSPVGGAKLVTSIVVENVGPDYIDFDVYFDDVSVELDVPGAAIYGKGYLIKNGDSSASTADGTDLGLASAGTPVTQDFEIKNLGDATLTLDANVTVTGAGFSITQQPLSSIAVGGSSTFTVSFDPTASGSVTGTVTISNNSEADDYTFEVAGEGDVDTDPPGLNSFERQTPGTQNTNTDTLVFRATFDEDVQYVTTGDFAVTGTSATVTAVSAVSASVYDLTVSGGDLASYDGTVGINLAGGQDIADMADNALPAGEPAIDETYLVDNTAPTDPTPSSSSHSISVWDDDPTVDIQISGDGDTGSGVDGFEVAWDQSASWTPTKTKEQEETWTGATFTAPSDGGWYFHIATVDNVGNWTSTQHLGPFQIDTTPPSVPSGLDPTSGSAINDTSPVLSWSASTDTGGSGIRTADAYRIVITGPVSRDTYVSDTDYNPTLSEGTFTWKVYARDNAGNSSSYSADTTLIIDATAPTDPTPTSSSHTVSVWSTDDTVDISFSAPASDAGSGVDGFEVAWDQSATWTPTETKEHEENWAGATYTATSDGDWYFHIGTVDNAGNWTNTQHLGPFKIDATAPVNPAVSCTTHTAGSWSNDGYIHVAGFASSSDVTSGVDGYEFEWSNSATWTPTGTKELEESALSMGFHTVWDGDWYFHIATVDHAGNWAAHDTYGPYRIDTIPPNVTVERAAGQADPTNVSPVLFTIEFDEPIAVATFTYHNVVVGGTATTGTVTLAEVEPFDKTTFSASVPVTSDGTVTATVWADHVDDHAGNGNTEATSTDNEVYYDGSKPSVTIDQATTQNDPTNTSPVVFTAIFDEPIESVSFTGGDVSTSGSATRGAINVVEVAPLDGTTFEVRIELLTDGNVVATIPAGVVQDPYGNTNNASTSTNNEVVFETDPPAIVSVTPNAAYDADAGSLSVSITFDEPMDPGTNPSPTITGLATDPYTITGSAWSNGNQTWTGTFTFADNNETATGTYQISGFKDLAGNTMAPNSAKSIEVDTENPAVLSLDASDLAITDVDAGGGLFRIITIFDQTMDTTVAPAIHLDPDVSAGGSATLNLHTSFWSDTHIPGDTFTMFYHEVDANIDIDSVSVDVTGGMDPNGNLQENHSPAGEFEVDTLNPAVSGVAVSDPLITQRDTGGLFTVTVDFSEPMDLGDDPSIVFVPALPTTLSLASEGWVDTTTYEAIYDIADGDVIEESVSIRVSGASDVLGNGQVVYASDRSFAVDTKSRERDDLVVHPAGSAGGAGFLDRWLGLEEDEEPPMIGTLPLSAVYEIGETVTGACRLQCSMGTPVHDSRIFLYLYRTAIDRMSESREPVSIMIVRCDRSLGEYCFELETSDLEPGIYDIYLGFENGTAEILRIELV